MNKKLITAAVAAAMAVPMMANAGGNAKVYGAVHQAFQMVTVGDEDAVYTIDGTARKANKLGMKGSVDTNLMDAKAVYQFEMGLNSDGEKGSYFQRDTWAGLSSKSMGTVRAGTIATGWKSTAKMVDPLFTTALEGRSGVVGGASSQLAGGTGTGRGRATHTVRYDSPSMGGAKVVANYSFAPEKDNIGVGVEYKMSGVAAFFNYQTSNMGDEDLSAMKVGAKATFGDIGVSGAYAIDGGALSQMKDGEANHLYLAGTYGMGATTLIVNFGMSDDMSSTMKSGRTGFGFAVSQQVAKKVAIYGGYGMSSGDDSDNDVSALAIGMKAGF
jgi:predicted porin